LAPFDDVEDGLGIEEVVVDNRGSSGERGVAESGDSRACRPAMAFDEVPAGKQ
jgi:hypothetical protein